jgi:hypothetical protein
MEKSQGSVVGIKTGVQAVGPTQPSAVDIRGKAAGAWRGPLNST